MDKFDDTVKKIVTMEWDMFQSVNEGGPRASCQDDFVTFEGMRRGQLEAWSAEVCEAYADDLIFAELDGRNLVEEKYIHMMRNVSPEQYARLIKNMTMPDDVVKCLAQQISDKLIKQTEVLFETYPYVTGAGRPLRSISDFTGTTSIETYQMGELLTYSERTLRALLKHLLRLEQDGEMLARRILEKSVRHYGYKTLDEAEVATRARVDKIGIQFSYGCSNNAGCR